MNDHGTAGAAGRGGLPVDRTREGGRGGCLVGCLGRPLILAGWGLLLLYGLACCEELAHPDRAREEELLRAMAVTPLRSLVSAPGAARRLPFHEGELIRVEGFLRADVPLAAINAKDDLYALQYLEITHKESRGGEDSVSYDVTDDRRYYYPPHLWLDVSAGEADEGGVEVSVPQDWAGYRFHSQPLSGMVEKPGTVPPEVAGALALTSIPPGNEQTWTLWAIRQSARVTVLAVARLRQGRVVLALSKEHWCAVSPDAWIDIIDGGYPPLWLYGCVGGLLVFLPVPWHYWQRRRSRRL